MFGTSNAQSDFINGIVALLFRADRININSWLQQIVVKNQKLGASNENGFRFAGRTFSTGPCSLRPPPLDISLSDEMTQLVEAQRKIDENAAFVRQMIFNVIDPCLNYQDLRDALPDCIVQMVDGLSDLPREREVAYTLKDRPMIHRQFARIYPIIQAASASRLL